MKEDKSKSRRLHWTAKKSENYRYFVAADFVDQLRECADLRGVSQRDFAAKLDLTEGRVSQVFNDPGNLTLNTMVDWTRALGFKTSIVVYDDGDFAGLRGPLSGSIFSECWKRSGAPLEWQPMEQETSITVTKPCSAILPEPEQANEEFEDANRPSPANDYALAA